MNKILITMGDPSGIGPEIIIKFFQEFNKKKKNYLPVVIGSSGVLTYYNKILKTNLKIECINNNEEIKSLMYKKDIIYLINEVEIDMNDIQIGEISSFSGKLSMDYLKTGIELVKNKYFNAIVTCPVNKYSINLAGYNFSGHTEFLAEKTNTKDYAMILAGDKIKVLLNSTHVSLSDAIKKVKKENIYKKILLANKAKQELGLKGKIAVAGLNPHNGENDLMGREEITDIIPAVEQAQKGDIDVEGPIVPDTLFPKMLNGEYVLAVTMYHDQGLIPMKMESFETGVNITIGLPIVRTSVDHGTAFDIAGKMIASPKSLENAVLYANRIIKNRMRRG